MEQAVVLRRPFIVGVSWKIKTGRVCNLLSSSRLRQAVSKGYTTHHRDCISHLPLILIMCELRCYEYVYCMRTVGVIVHLKAWQTSSNKEQTWIEHDQTSPNKDRQLQTNICVCWRVFGFLGCATTFSQISEWKSFLQTFLWALLTCSWYLSIND